MGSTSILDQVNEQLVLAGMTRQDVVHWYNQTMMDGFPSDKYLHQPVRGREGYQLCVGDFCRVVQYLPTPDIGVVVLEVLRGDVCDVVKFICIDDDQIGFVRRDGLHKLCDMDGIGELDFATNHIKTKAESQLHYEGKRQIKQAMIALALALQPLLAMK